MASRKDEKQQRRAERLEAEAAAAGEARRKKLLTAVGATALAAVVVVVALILVSQSGDDNSGNASEISSDLPVLASIDSLEQAGNTVGDPNAKVTIYEFGDLQCPACKEFSESVIPELLAAEGPVGAGEAQLAFENFVIIGDESVDAAKAALAAGEQGRMWQYVEIFYANQGIENSGYVTDDFLTAVADAAGVEDIDAWNEARQDPKWDAELQRITQQAANDKLTGTPSVVVEGPGGREVLGTFPDTAAIEQAIREVS
jgi:protein-disulfide isomerase